MQGHEFAVAFIFLRKIYDQRTLAQLAECSIIEIDEYEKGMSMLRARSIRKLTDLFAKIAMAEKIDALINEEESK